MTNFAEMEDTNLFANVNSGMPFRVVNATIGVALFNEVALSGSLLYLLHVRSRGTKTAQTGKESVVKRIVWLISSSALVIVMYALVWVLVRALDPDSFANFALEINSSAGKNQTYTSKAFQ